MAFDECYKCGYEYGKSMLDESDPFILYDKRMKDYKNGDDFDEEDGKPTKPDPNSNRVLKVWTREVDDEYNVIYTCPNCGYENKVPVEEDL